MARGSAERTRIVKPRRRTPRFSRIRRTAASTPAPSREILRDSFQSGTSSLRFSDSSTIAVTAPGIGRASACLP